MDVTPKRYASRKDVEQYWYLVASTVGLRSLPIIGLAPRANPDLTAAFAIKLGIALQLTNTLRDTGEDIGRGRFYLALEDLRAFGLTEQNIRQRKADERFAALMEIEIRRARSLYREALPGIALLDRSVRAAVGTAALLYRGILTR